MGIPMLKIRRSQDRLSFNMRIPMLVRRHFLLRWPPVPDPPRGWISKMCIWWMLRNHSYCKNIFLPWIYLWNNSACQAWLSALDGSLAMRMSEHRYRALHDYAKTGNIQCLLKGQHNLIAIVDSHGDTWVDWLIETITKWPTLCRRHIQMDVFEWKCLNLE